MFSCQKHFSKNKLVQNDKKINNITDTKKSKRASFSASKFFMLKLFRSEEGAMTLEATLIVPIFLIVLIKLQKELRLMNTRFGRKEILGEI